MLKKTEVIIFTGARLKDDEFPNSLIMGKNRIEFGTSVKYPGLWLDHKLNWSVNTEDKIKKAKQSLGL